MPDTAAMDSLAPETPLGLTERETGRKWVINAQCSASVGRSAQNDIWLFHFAENRTLSRVHATFLYRDKRWYLRDNHSRYGTTIDGHLLTSNVPCLLRPGNVIRFGDSCTFIVDG